MLRKPQTPEQSNFAHLVIDVVWFGLALAATSRFMSIFAIRLGATPTELSWLASLPGLVLFFSAGMTAWWRRHYSDSIRALKWPGLTFRLVFLLPAFAPFFPSEWQIPWLLAAVVLTALPQGIAGAIFLVIMRESVSQQQQGALTSMRTLALNITVAIGAVAFGFLLEKLPFPLNYQIMFVAAFVFAFLSFWHVTNIHIIYPEPAPKQPGSKINVWKLPSFLPVAVVTAAAYVAFFSIIMITPLRLVNDLGASEGFIAAFGLAELVGGATAAMITSRIMRRMDTRLFIGLSMMGTALAATMIALMPALELTLVAAFISGGAWTASTIAIYMFLVEQIPLEASTGSSTAYQQVMALSIFVGPLLGGWLYDNGLSLVAVLLVGAGLRMLAGFYTYASSPEATRSANPMRLVRIPLRAQHGQGRREGRGGRGSIRNFRIPGSSRGR